MAIPSLAMRPSAEAANKLYSVLPNNGDGDFQFNRDSSATLINSKGLIQTVGYFGNELITNGNFATDSDWNKNSNWTISGGTANCDGTSNSDINQGTSLFTPVLGKTYKVSIEITSISQGGIRVSVGGSGTSYYTSTGIYTSYLTTISTDRVRMQPQNSAIGSIDNVSVKEVLGDRPRFNYEITNGLVGGCPSLLLEGASTNLITYSEAFDNAYWTKSGASVTSGFISPDGTSNAFKLVEDTSTGQHKVDPQSISVVSGTSYTSSLFVKKDTRDILQMVWSGSFGSSYVNFDLTNGSFQASSGVTGKIESFTNGWYKCSITQAAAATGSGRCQILLQDSISASRFGSYTGNGASGIYIYGAQSEALSYPTSYIPTNGSLQTRAAETCNDAGTASTFNSTEGVLYFEGSALADDNTDKRLFLSDGTMNNYVAIGYSRFTGNIISEMVSGGVLQTINWGATGVTQTNNNKFALSWGSGTMKFYVNGTQTNTESVTSPTGLNVLEFNTAVDTLFMFSNTRDLRVYNTALTDAQLQTLTTL